MKRKAVSLLLALLIAVSLLPGFAVATSSGTPEEASAYAYDFGQRSPDPDFEAVMSETASDTDDAKQFRPDPDAEVIVLDPVTEYNPIYIDVFKPEQFEKVKSTDETRGRKAAVSTPVYAATLEAAGTQLRSNLKAHINSFSVYWAVPKSLFDTYGADAFQGALWSEAVKITTNGREGDYLEYTWWERSCDSSYVISDDGNNVLLTLAYSIIYVGTSAAQESEMAARADDTIGYFGFTRQTSAYDKIRTIYDYVAANIRYTAAANVNTPLYHSAYSAIVMKDTVCQGYALLLYYMFWRCGIPCRIISGNGGGGGHAWNLVWLRGQWYSLDVTWDNATTPTHDFFLRGSSTGFYGDGNGTTHKPNAGTCTTLVNNSSFGDYGDKKLADYGCCSVHTDAASAYTTDSGTTCYWCSACGQSATGSFGTYRYVDSGYCGDNLIWGLDSDGCLKTIGSGDMWDNKIIWYPHRNCVLSADLSSEMTSIGSFSFENCDYLTGVGFPASLTHIGESAFCGCDSLSWVMFNDVVAQIDLNAFYGCNALTDVYYFGTASQWNAISIADGNTALTNARKHFACTVTFNANGGTGDMARKKAFSDLSFTLSNNSFTRDGYTFKAWNTKADGSGTTYADGAEMTLTSDLTLYAQWKPVTATLTGEAQFGKNMLTWTAVPNATKYMMYRREYNGSAWTSWTAKNKSITGTAWTDSSVTAGYTYEYKVRACVGGVFGEYSNTFSVTGAELTAPVLTGGSIAGKNILNWSAVDYASTYQVWRREYNGGWSTWTRVAALTGTNWTDTDVTVGRQYQYRVRSGLNNAWSEFSTALAVTTIAGTPRPALTSEVELGSNILSWTEVPTATYYRVLWRQWNDGWTSWTQEPMTKNLSWTHDGVVEGRPYQYRVKAYANGGWGDFSNIVTLTAATTDPVTLATVEGEAQPGQNVLSWNMVTGTTYYHVYRRENSGSGWSSWTPVATVAVRSYTDKKIHSGWQYQYRIQAYADGAWGTISPSILALTAQ